MGMKSLTEGLSSWSACLCVYFNVLIEMVCCRQLEHKQNVGKTM